MLTNLTADAWFKKVVSHPVWVGGALVHINGMTRPHGMIKHDLAFRMVVFSDSQHALLLHTQTGVP